MKRTIVFAVAFAAVAMLNPTWQTDEPGVDKEKQFGLELQTCKEAFAAGTPGKCDLYGKIKVVDHHEDVKIKKVDHHEDIKVEWVSNNADSAGEWEKVRHHEDYKVKFVDHHEDYKAKMGSSFPGCN